MPRSPLFRLRALLFLAGGTLCAQTISVAPERASGIYQTGEKIRWQVTVTEPAKLTNPQYTIKSGGLTNIASGALVLTDGKAMLEATGTQPGWFLLEVKGTSSAAAALQTNGGALVSPEKITPSSARPADFDTFWAAKLAELAAVPINPVVTTGASDRSGVDYATVTLDCVKGTHVQGQLARPTTGAKFPALLILQWAGVYSLQKGWATSRAAEGWLVLNTQAHDIAPIESDAYYAALNTGALNNYPHIGNDDRETSYFLRMYLAAYRAAEYLTTRPDWDGRTLVVTGGSQGGLQSLVVAALHPKVTAAIADVPAGSDQGGLDVGRVPGWPVWAWQAWDRDLAKVKQAAAYFDVTHFAPRIHCPVLLATGLIDTVVPPVGVYSTYNLLTGARRIIPMPLADHTNGHDAYYPVQNEWLADARAGKTPVVRLAPQPVSAKLGDPVLLAVSADNGAAYGYQWFRNGAALSGATGDRLALTQFAAADAGDYSVAVTTPGGTATSAAARVAVAADNAPVSPAHMASLSTRCFVGTDSSIGIAGFVLERPATVLIRGMGPSLEPLGVSGVLRKPVLKLFDLGRTLLAENTGWKSDAARVPALTSTMAALGAFAPTNNDDSMLHVALPAGVFTAQLSGLANTTGNGLIEVYLDWTVSGTATDCFAALSSRCFVGTDASIAVAGFVLNEPSTLLIRAVGPSLADLGVTGAIAQPVLNLYTLDRRVIARNAGWRDNPADVIGILDGTMQRTGAFALSTAADSALRLTLPSGIYTAQVSGLASTTGNGLVEVYLVR